MKKRKVLVIVGPTASGKSDLAVKLAKKFDGEVISADSRQVYRGLNVGTGKITKKEMQGVKHHLLDVADPKKQFSASDFLTLTSRAIVEIVNTCKLPIVVGGTGFYIDTLTGDISLPEVPPNKLLRKRLGGLHKTKLFKLLEKKDPERSKNIDKDNKVRLIRALEIIDALGKVPKVKKVGSPYEFIYIGLKPRNLDERIYKRLMKRMPGMIREVKNLIQTKKLTYKRMQELGLEYKYLALYLQGKLDKSQMIQDLNIASKNYAKRQMRWFKRNKKIRWFTLSAVEGFSGDKYKEIEAFCFNSMK